MKNLIAELRESIPATVVLAVLCGGIYPVVVWAAGRDCSPAKPTAPWSEWTGRSRDPPSWPRASPHRKYFHPRPSAAGRGYDAASSSGTNLGPTSKKLIEDVKRRVAGYRQENGLATGCLGAGRCRDVVGQRPGSPHQPANAALQAGRVADTARHRRKRSSWTGCGRTRRAGPSGLLGEPRVNVLMLNLDLDGKM